MKATKRQRSLLTIMLFMTGTMVMAEQKVKEGLSIELVNVIETGATSSDGDVYKVTTQRLNVRATPSANGRLVGTLDQGATVTVERIENGWALINYDGKTCYVSARYLSIVEEENKINAEPQTEIRHEATQQVETVKTVTPSQTNREPVDLGDDAVFVSYYYFNKDLYNYGASYTKMRANKIGYESNFRTSFKTNSNYNVDICANYTYILAQKDDWVMGGKVAIGPSFRSQSYIDADYDIKTGQIKQTSKTKSALDLYFDAGFFCKYKHFFAFIGGTGWAAEWKFGDNYYQTGFHLSIGCTGLF